MGNVARNLSILAAVLSLGCSDRLTGSEGGDDTGDASTSESSTSEESGDTTGADESDGNGDGDGDGGNGDGDGDDDDGHNGCEPTFVDHDEIDGVEGNLLAIIEGAIAYYDEVQPEGTPHICPHPDGVPEGGNAFITPDIAFDCNCGPEARCIPAVGGGGAGYYDVALWLDNPMWSAVGFSIEAGTPHAFKYDLMTKNTLEGEGACTFMAIAHADFDDDAEFSIYSISGFVDQDGAQIDPMVVEHPFE